jgi:hypothetical protein
LNVKRCSSFEAECHPKSIFFGIPTSFDNLAASNREETMRFKVTGQNKTTAARMVLEFEAESKAAAERKALSQGMTVNRVEDVTDGYTDKAHEPHPRAGRRSGKRNLMPILALILIIAVVYYFWPNISHMIHR